MPFPTARRILLKISGEFLQGEKTHGICWNRLQQICEQLAQLSQYEFALVIGGGNFFRGVDGYHDCPLAIADNIGMMATVMNGLACLAAFRKIGRTGRLFCSRAMDGIGEVYSFQQAQDALERKEIVICAAGLGHGAMTTDTAAVVRACELECDLIIKGTSVQGIYSDDPLKNPQAIFHKELTYDQVLTHKLRIMDLTALTLASEAKKPLIVFSLAHPKGLVGLLRGEIEYSLVRG